ncbi:unnamed protein product [Amoebophrya sp. A25]|nr:unnamed protein product [Amoebophrya sp. A25]|eukprot:GSA25T00020156001.1
MQVARRGEKTRTAARRNFISSFFFGVSTNTSAPHKLTQFLTTWCPSSSGQIQRVSSWALRLTYPRARSILFCHYLHLGSIVFCPSSCAARSQYLKSLNDEFFI